MGTYKEVKMDTNTYTSKQNIKKYTTQAKFDAIDKSDVPVGTEYNIVGSITESDLDSDLQAKVNLTGDNLTTEVTGGKVKVKNPMTSTGGNGFKLNSFYNATTGVTYFFPIETPIGHFATGIVPILGSVTGTKPGSTAPATYQGVFLPNAYSENNYGPNAYGMLTMSESHNSGSQIYILPYCASNPGVSYLLNNESLIAGNGITIQGSSAGPGKLEISYSGSGSPSIGSKTYADFVLGAHPEIVANYGEPESGTVYAAGQPAADGGSGYTRFVLLAPTGDISATLNIPNKSGTLATLDDITGGGTTYTAGKNIAIDGTMIAVADELTGLSSVSLGYDTSTGSQLNQIGLNIKNPGGRVELSPQNLTFFDFETELKPYTTLAAHLGTTKSTAIYLPAQSGDLTLDSSFKTLFGNQNIVGDGNIDLYKHHIVLHGSDGKFELSAASHSETFLEIISSKNLVVDSLTALKTLLGNTFVAPVFGSIWESYNDVLCACFSMNETTLYYEYEGAHKTMSLSNITFTDEVTTV